MLEPVQPHLSRDSRSRSRSPHTHDSHQRSRRTRSPHQHQNTHTHIHHPRQHRHTLDVPHPSLPFSSRQLSKRDYEVFKPMFALYLDIQKNKILADLDTIEAKGRWKSFIGKWNRGELSEGWYDPETLAKAVISEKESGMREKSEEKPQLRSAVKESDSDREQESDSDGSIGPALPGQEGRPRGRMGPTIPNTQDLRLKREMEVEDGLASRDDIRFARKVDRKEQKAALDELVPRAEAGTRERQLEKKKELNEKMKSFREKSPGAVEVPDTELMGGGDEVEEFKKTKQDFERKKNERELRKEEILRARQAEREERLQEYRAKEEGTMEMLKALAKQRFG